MRPLLPYSKLVLSLLLLCIFFFYAVCVIELNLLHIKLSTLLEAVIICRCGIKQSPTTIMDDWHSFERENQGDFRWAGINQYNGLSMQPIYAGFPDGQRFIAQSIPISLPMAEPQPLDHRILPRLKHEVWPVTLTNSPTVIGQLPAPPLIREDLTKPNIPSPTSRRKTLTDSDRRRICQYYVKHPLVKQKEIGGKSHANQY